MALCRSCSISDEKNVHFRLHADVYVAYRGSFAREVFGRLGKNYGGIFFGEEFLVLGFPKSGSTLANSGNALLA